MTDEELIESLFGLYAYDTGSTDSGVKDERLRQQVVEEIHQDIEDYQLFSRRLSKIAREMFLSDEALEQGFGLEDIRDFVDWIDRRMRPSS